MGIARFIHCPLIVLAGCQPWSAQQLVPAAQPVPATYPTTGAPPVVAAPPFLQTSPVIQSAPPVVPVYPPPSTVVPLPSQTPGSIFGPPAVELPAPAESDLHSAMPAPITPPGAAPPLPATAPLAPPSSVVVPVVNEDVAWEQIVDVVSEYFPIAREHRARRGEVWTEGRIETVPQSGATWFEPHRHDSVGTFNRWESTFQSIRRHAIVRVVPEAAGFLVEVIVEKELEDLPTPEKATAGAVTFRNDGSLPSRRLEQKDRMPSSARWIPLGRDPPLEQRMLAEIHARLSGITTASGSVFTR